MGMFKAKCLKCWDPMPCSCPQAHGSRPEPKDPRLVSLLERQNVLLEEQNRLLRSLATKKD